MKLRLRDGMEINVKHVTGDWDRHGNLRFYVRQGHGPKFRLTDEDLASVETFKAKYAAALSGQTLKSESSVRLPAAPGSLRWLVEAYYKNSPAYALLDETTAGARRRLLDGLCERHGTKPYRLMERRHVVQIRDEKKDAPEAGNARVKALRQVFAWAVDVEHVKANPAQGVGKLAPLNPDGFHTWTVEEVRQYEARHPIGTKARKALALFLYTGLRISDVVRLGPQMERDGKLHITEAKGRSRAPKRRELPILPELRAAIDAAPSGHLAYLTTEHGRPFASPNSLANKFKDWCVKAGLPHCAAHGLRKAGATFAAENGATEHQLMALYGWASPKQAAHYTRKANANKLAAGAMHLIAPTQNEDEIPPLHPRVASGGGKRGGK